MPVALGFGFVRLVFIRLFVIVIRLGFVLRQCPKEPSGTIFQPDALLRTLIPPLLPSRKTGLAGPVVTLQIPQQCPTQHPHALQLGEVALDQGSEIHVVRPLHVFDFETLRFRRVPHSEGVKELMDSDGGDVRMGAVG